MNNMMIRRPIVQRTHAHLKLESNPPSTACAKVVSMHSTVELHTNGHRKRLCRTEQQRGPAHARTHAHAPLLSERRRHDLPPAQRPRVQQGELAVAEAQQHAPLVRRHTQ
jgi:hypothetical protein